MNRPTTLKLTTCNMPQNRQIFTVISANYYCNRPKTL